MTGTSEHEAGDRYMSGWVATCVHDGARLYVTEDRLFSDDLRRAAWRRWPSEADRVAAEAACPGFPMLAETVASLLSGVH